MAASQRGGVGVPPKTHPTLVVPAIGRPGISGHPSQIHLRTAGPEESGLSGSVSRSVPAPAPPGPGPAGPGRPLVEVRWIAFAEVLLNVAKPAGDVSTQPALGKEPKAGRRMVANPLRIHELPHAPAGTERDAASHQRPPHDCQHIPQRVPQLLPCRPVRIPVSHLTHLQPWRPNPGERDHP